MRRKIAPERQRENLHELRALKRVPMPRYTSGKLIAGPRGSGTTSGWKAKSKSEMKDSNWGWRGEQCSITATLYRRRRSQEAGRGSLATSEKPTAVKWNQTETGFDVVTSGLVRNEDLRLGLRERERVWSVKWHGSTKQ